MSARQVNRHMPTLQETSLNADMMKIAAAEMGELKTEMGIGTKDLPSLSFDEKVCNKMFSLFRFHSLLAQARIVGLAKARGYLPGGTKPGQAPNATPGPSNMPPPGQPRPPTQPPLTQQGQIPRNGKRSSTSPGEDVS